MDKLIQRGYQNSKSISREKNFKQTNDKELNWSKPCISLTFFSVVKNVNKHIFKKRVDMRQFFPNCFKVVEPPKVPQNSQKHRHVKKCTL